MSKDNSRMRGAAITIATGAPTVSSQIRLSPEQREEVAKQKERRNKLEDLALARANREPWEVSRG